MTGKKHSDESKEKMSKAKRGKIPWNKGIPCSLETKNKIREKVSGINHPNYGKHLSKETRQKISENNKIK